MLLRIINVKHTDEVILFHCCVVFHDLSVQFIYSTGSLAAFFCQEQCCPEHSCLNLLLHLWCFSLRHFFKGWWLTWWIVRWLEKEKDCGARVRAWLNLVTICRSVSLLLWDFLLWHQEKVACVVMEESAGVGVLSGKCHSRTKKQRSLRQ